MKNKILITISSVVILMASFVIPVKAQELDLSGIELPSIPTITKPINQMTKPELQVKIQEIMTAIQQLQTILAQALQQGSGISNIPSSYSFSANLKYGTSSTEVIYLQIFLNADPDTRVSNTGWGSPGQESMYFGSKTKQAVIKFQEKYASEILTPWKLSKGTGFVGQTTRDKINQLLEQYRSGIAPGEEEEPLTYCGDGIIQTPNTEGINELCDGLKLNNQTCITKGYTEGTLKCSSTCLTFDTSQCLNKVSSGGSSGGSSGTATGPVCGNNTDNICPQGCTHAQDTNCTYCGDNILQTPNDEGTNEVCDTNKLNNQTCITKGFTAGTLQCSSNCLTFNTANCTSPTPPTNHAPILNTIGNKSTNENNALTFTISATDPDNNTLSYSVSNRPSGSSFNSTTRTFSWTPTYEQSGTYNLTFIVSDSELTDTETITITVANVETCTPTTCLAQGKNCGTISDGCSGTLNCGTCSSGYTCQSGICVQDIIVSENAIYVDNQLINDCDGNYSIANRSCSGNDGDAYNTAQEAADTSTPGDTIYFRAGTYYSRASTQAVVPVLRVIISGTVANPITYRNYNNEEVILDAWDEENNRRKRRAVELGDQPSSSEQTLTGQGVQNIIIDGLIVEGGAYAGLSIFGPADAYNDPENPTENVIIRHVIACYNTGTGGRGISSQGTLINVTIEYCEAYENQITGISFGRMAKFWHDPEPDDQQSAARYSTIRNCLSYNNNDPGDPGDTDGLGGSNMYRCIVENNVVFNNSDDGIDNYASIETTVRNNIVFGHSYEGGNNAGIKFSAGGGGKHTIAGNVVFNNDGFSLEGSDPSNPQRIYYPSKIYNNIMYKGSTGIALGYVSNYNLTFPGYESSYLHNNVMTNNINHDIYHAFEECTDSDYNFIGNAGDLSGMHGKGLDTHSLTGDPQLANPGVVIDANFGSGWTIEQKLEHIRSQARVAFSLNESSQLIDNGAIIPGYHCSTVGAYPGEDCKEWYGDAPDIGAYEYQGEVPPPSCSGTDTSCGTWPSCTNCNALDGCSGTSYRNYSCSGTSCVFTENNCTDCSCSCGGYNTTESIANSNCNDGIDNDCDGNIDFNDTGCQECTSGQTSSCATGLQGICSSGTKTCQANGIWGSCVQNNQPTTEVCNDSLDNDCDGATDCSDTDCSAEPACATAIPTDYISFWKFENNALDETGINNGTLYGDASFVNNPNKGNVVSFDGDGDCINVGSPNLVCNSTQMSVIAWIKMGPTEATAAGQDGIVSQNDTSPRVFVLSRINSEKFRFRVYDDNQVATQVDSSSSWTDTNWHQIVGVYNGSTIQVYIDGNLNCSPVAFISALESTPSVVKIGRGDNGSFEGSIDDVMIYNRALTEQEIQNIYDAQKPAEITKVEPKELDLNGLASILDAIQEAINELKSLF